MSTRAESPAESSQRRQPPPVPPKRRTGLLRVSTSSVTASASIYSKYLMNDIPRDTKRIALINYLLLSPYGQHIVSPGSTQPNVLCGAVIQHSRLDDELSVATIEFSDTPQWLQDLNNDPNGFPKKTALGTVWRGIDIGTGEPNELGQTEFIRAVIAGNLLYAETLAEFAKTDVNMQDKRGRTALHWACEGGLPEIVKLCLSVVECQVGLLDNDGLTAFDIAQQTHNGAETIPSMFYRDMWELDQAHPQVALLRALTVTSEPASMTDKPIFPGAAMFDPIHTQNLPLVSALVNRGIDLTVRDQAGHTALHVAAAVGNTEIATRLLEGGSEVDAVDDAGATPLHHAARTGLEMVQVLLDWKADVTVKDENEQSAFNWATEYEQPVAAQVLLAHAHTGSVGQEDSKQLAAFPLAEQNDTVHAVELLQGVSNIDVPAVLEQFVVEKREKEALALARREALLQRLEGNIELKNEEGMTPLQQAAESGDLDSVRILLELGADLLAVTEYGLAALHLAAQSGHTETVTALLAGGADIEAMNNSKWTPLHYTAHNGHTETVKALLAGGADIEAKSSYEYTPLHLAAQNGHTETVTALLAGGADIEAIDHNKRTPLHYTAHNGHTKTVKTLLAGGADIEAKDDDKGTPLHRAAHYGHTETVKALLAGGADIEAKDYDKWTPLHRAAHYGHTETVKALLAGGADIEAKDDDKGTPLHRAAHYGHTETVKALLAGGADIEAKSNYKWTPLHLAAQNGHTETVKALLAGGADIEAKDYDKWTPLHFAAHSGRTETVKALLAGGADIEAKSDDEWTPLHCAAIYGYTETVKALLAGGAQIEAQCNDGTALQVAYKYKKSEVAKILRAAGARNRAERLRYAIVQPFQRKDQKSTDYTPEKVEGS